MNYRKLGQTDVAVSEVSLRCNLPAPRRELSAADLTLIEHNFAS